jgi:hypothetical protein
VRKRLVDDRASEECADRDSYISAHYIRGCNMADVCLKLNSQTVGPRGNRVQVWKDCMELSDCMNDVNEHVLLTKRSHSLGGREKLLYGSVIDSRSTNLHWTITTSSSLNTNQDNFFHYSTSTTHCLGD